MAVGTFDRRGRPTTVDMNLRCPENGGAPFADEPLDLLEQHRDGDSFGGVTSDGQGLRDPLEELIAREDRVVEEESDPYAHFLNQNTEPAAPPTQRELAKCDAIAPAGTCPVVVKPRRKLGPRNKPSERATAADLRKFAG